MKRPVREQLDDLPDQSIRPLSGWTMDELRAWAAHHQQRFAVVDLSDCNDKSSALRQLGRALELPSWFGANLDALYDALTDDETWPIGRGAVIVLDPMPRGGRFGVEERDALLDVFRAIAAHYAERGAPFRVFYR